MHQNIKTCMTTLALSFSVATVSAKSGKLEANVSTISSTAYRMPITLQGNISLTPAQVSGSTSGHCKAPNEKASFDFNVHPPVRDLRSSLFASLGFHTSRSLKNKTLLHHLDDQTFYLTYDAMSIADAVHSRTKMVAAEPNRVTGVRFREPAEVDILQRACGYFSVDFGRHSFL